MEIDDIPEDEIIKFENTKLQIKQAKKTLATLESSLNQYIKSIKGIVTPSENISDSIDQFYGNENVLGKCFKDSASSLKDAIDKFNSKSETIFISLNQYTLHLNPILKRISERDKMKDEYTKRKKEYHSILNRDPMKARGSTQERKFSDAKNNFSQINQVVQKEMNDFLSNRAIEFDNILIMIIALKTDLFRSVYESYLKLDSVDPTQAPVKEIDLKGKNQKRHMKFLSNDSNPTIGRPTNVVKKDRSSLFISSPSNLTYSTLTNSFNLDTIVFGCDLSKLKAVENDIPKIIIDCTKEIYNRGLHEEGLFRTAGSVKRLNELKLAYDSGTPPNLSNEEIPLICSLLKAYLRSLPQHILTNEMAHKFEEEIAKQGSMGAIDLLEKLPKRNLSVLYEIIKLMIEIDKNSDKNKMTFSNLYIIFTQVFNVSNQLLQWFIKHEFLFSTAMAQRVSVSSRATMFVKPTMKMGDINMIGSPKKGFVKKPPLPPKPKNF